MRPELSRLLVLLGLGASTALAQSIPWLGTSSTFVSGPNWVGGVAPGPANTAQFGNHGGATNIVVNSTTIGAIEFLSTRTAIHNFTYTDGVATLTLNGNFTAQSGPAINFLPSGPHRLDLALSSGEHVFDIGSGTTVTIAGLVTGTGHLSKVGAGTLVLTAANTLNYNGVGGFNNGVAVDRGILEVNGGSISQPFQDIIVGSVPNGTGALVVTNGGDVTTKYGVAGNDSNTNAAITVTGAGSTWTNSQGMAVGYLGTGFLNILDGGTVTTTGSGTDHSYLGLQSGTAGTAVVSGAGSAWSTPNDMLIVGGGGTGTLTVAAGGVVSSSTAEVGRSFGGIGLAVITGSGSAWNSAGDVNIGRSGTGTLTVADGGKISANNGASAIALASSGGTGVLNIGAGGGAAAPGGIVNALFITSGSGTGTVQFGTSSSTFSDPYYLTRDGTPGGAAVTITGSTSVENTWGFNALTGANTYTGGTHIHHGTLMVRGAGSISHGAANLVVSPDSGDNGALHVDGGADVTVSQTRFGVVAGSAGYGTVTGSGSTLTNTSYLYVGLAGFGELWVSDGGAVTSSNTSIGNNIGGDGEMSVTGAGSTLTNTNNLYVGSEGGGYLEITDGGLVSNQTGSVGNNLGGQGAVYLFGGTWNSSSFLIVGNADDGYVDAYGASTLTANHVTIGALTSGYGELYLNGNGTTLTAATHIMVGADGDGYLDITSGADATASGNLVVGNASTSFGDVYLRDPGTSLSAAGAILGNNGIAELFLSEGSLLSLASGEGTVTLGASGTAFGRLFLGYYAGVEGGEAAGILNADTITTGLGNGEVVFGSVGSSLSAPYYFTKDGTSTGAGIAIAGSTHVLHEAGYTVLRNASSYTGGTQVTGGTLVVGQNSALGTGGVIVDGGILSIANGVTFGNSLGFGAAGGTLGGNGSFSAPLTLGADVTIAPGDSPGTLNFLSGLTLNDGGTLAIEVQGATGTPGTDWDFLNITGTLNLTPLTTGNYTLQAISLNLAGSPGAVSGLGSSGSWIIATASGGITGFDANDFTIDASQFVNVGFLSLTQSGNSLVLNFSPVPEPSTYALFALGLAVIIVAARRRRQAQH